MGTIVLKPKFLLNILKNKALYNSLGGFMITDPDGDSSYLFGRVVKIACVRSMACWLGSRTPA